MGPNSRLQFLELVGYSNYISNTDLRLDGPSKKKSIEFVGETS